LNNDAIHSFNVNLDKLVPECQMLLDSAVARDDGGGGNAKLQLNHHHPHTNTQYFHRPDALPTNQPTVSSTEGKNRTEKITNGNTEITSQTYYDVSSKLTFITS